jgi:uncharacterized protein YeaO (DUF488 family)
LHRQVRRIFPEKKVSSDGVPLHMESLTENQILVTFLAEGRMLKIKRAYEKPDAEDGFRVLVDRLWPRGVKKEQAKVDLWLKEIGPSNELRKWFGHEPGKCAEFRRRYFKELGVKDELVRQIEDRLKDGTVTLVYAARYEDCNNATVVREYVQRKAKKKRR